MDFQEFCYMSAWQQTMVIQNLAVPIAERCTDKTYYKLFQVDKFYIELQIAINSDFSSSYTAFQDTLGLEPYLDLISIDELIDSV